MCRRGLWEVCSLGISLRGSGMLGCRVRCQGGEGGDAGYQAVDVLGLQVEGSHNVHPHHALLREVLFLRPKRELARGLGSFRVLRKGVDAELALCMCQGGKVLAASLAAAAWLLTPSRRGPGSPVRRVGCVEDGRT